MSQVDREQVKRLDHVLVDEELTFSKWLCRQIDAYLKEKEPEGKRRERRGMRR